jgi:hypothetical protein
MGEKPKAARPEDLHDYLIALAMQSQATPNT